MENQRQETPKKVVPERTIFAIELRRDLITPGGIDKRALIEAINYVVDNYLSQEFKVSKIDYPTQPIQPGMPTPPANYIYELRDKMEDIR